tara:strand:- start:179 stop:1123 length:945 start_codon:yes stop_codon:yes gene_type:complete
MSEVVNVEYLSELFNCEIETLKGSFVGWWLMNEANFNHIGTEEAEEALVKITTTEILNIKQKNKTTAQTKKIKSYKAQFKTLNEVEYEVVEVESESENESEEEEEVVGVEAIAEEKTQEEEVVEEEEEEVVESEEEKLIREMEEEEQREEEAYRKKKDALKKKKMELLIANEKRKWLEANPNPKENVIQYIKENYGNDTTLIELIKKIPYDHIPAESVYNENPKIKKIASSKPKGAKKNKIAPPQKQFLKDALENGTALRCYSCSKAFISKEQTDQGEPIPTQSFKNHSEKCRYKKNGTEKPKWEGSDSERTRS